MSKLKIARDRLTRRSGRSPNTERAYEQCWRVFSAWCVSVGRPALPATDETVSLWTTAALESHRIAYLALAHAAINDVHIRAGLEPAVGSLSRSTLAGARRTKRERPGGKAALQVADLKRMVRHARGEGANKGARDAAWLLFGFASGLRRSELRVLEIGDLELVDKGLKVTIRASKTDQQARGRVMGIPYARHQEFCPVRAVVDWLERLGADRMDDHPLFPYIDRNTDVIHADELTGPQYFSFELKRFCLELGLDMRKYSAHSLRAGLVTAAAEADANPLTIMARTGHRSMRMVSRYFRPTQVFGADPLAKAL